MAKYHTNLDIRVTKGISIKNKEKGSGKKKREKKKGKRLQSIMMTCNQKADDIEPRHNDCKARRAAPSQ